MITAEQLGRQEAFPRDSMRGMDLRTWLVGKALEGVLASGRRPGTVEILEEINPLVDAILRDLADRVPEKKSIPIPKV